MKNSDINNMISSGNLLLLRSLDGKSFYLYFDMFRMLIPLKQPRLDKKYNKKNFKLDILPNTNLNGSNIRHKLIHHDHANIVFKKLLNIPKLLDWNISKKNWFIYDESYNSGSDYYIFNGETQKIQLIENRQDAYVLSVIYLTRDYIFFSKSKENDFDISKNLEMYGLIVDDRSIDYKIENNKYTNIGDHEMTKTNTIKEKGQDSLNIQYLLDCDKRRCGLLSYEKEILYDIKAGHWELFEEEELYNLSGENFVSRDPRLDIKKNGVIGIDFGTKSTVVVKQEGSNEIRPIRIGSLKLNANICESDYENPTIISCIDLNEFFKEYDRKTGRPDTSCEDLFVSYNAYNDFNNCPPENFYAYFSNLKQWANAEKKDVEVLDINNKEKYSLDEKCSLENHTLNPIEVYAYYIGMYINNMRNGIYLKYVMSFPVKYSKDTKELIRKSFENGLKKSLPSTIVEDTKIMSNFSVQYQISEPAAYAVTALELSGFKPKDENEKYLYGIFDFGGGTTDFDFGIWRGASEDEYDKYNCDYVLDCFGADSDVGLGGERILEMLAFNVFMNNKNIAAEKRIACALPAGETEFLGGENLIRNSRSANRNLTMLKERLRPLWEQHEDWESIYIDSSDTESHINGQEYKECIDIQLYNFDGEPVPNCKFEINTVQLIELIKKRIQKGVDSFFNCIERSILRNPVAQYASEKIYIFLAGNSCKSIFVKDIFQKTIEKYNSEYEEIRGNVQDRFVLIEPLKNLEVGNNYIPNAKTSVAYGLVKSRPGGKIYVIKNYETDSNKETRFKYYIGSERKGLFECRLSPMFSDDGYGTNASYNIWMKLQGAGQGIARIYYTEDPRADSKAEKLDINNIPFLEVNFDPDDNKYLYVRAVGPSVIEYAVANSADDIDDNYNTNTLNLDDR